MTQIRFLGGNFADHEALSAQLHRHAECEFLADWLGSADMQKHADAQYIELTRLAVLCGYRMAMNESALDWSSRRVAAFNFQRGRV